MNQVYEQIDVFKQDDGLVQYLAVQWNRAHLLEHMLVALQYSETAHNTAKQAYIMPL